MKAIKRFIAAILAIGVVASCIPMAAVAEENVLTEVQTLGTESAETYADDGWYDETSIATEYVSYETAAMYEETTYAEAETYYDYEDEPYYDPTEAAQDTTDATQSVSVSDSGTVGDHLTWTFNSASGTLTVSGNGYIYGENYYSAPERYPWHDLRENIREIVLEEGVTSISGYAFAGCINLASVTIKNPECGFSELQINNNYEEDDYGYVQTGYYSGVICGYRYSRTQSDAEYYGYTFESIGDPPYATSGTFGTLTWQFDVDTGVLTISGTGDMPDGGGVSVYPWYLWRYGVQEVVIEEGVTSIGSLAFDYYSKLTSVSIPASVTKIGYSAFMETPWYYELAENNPLVIINHILITADYDLEGDVVIPDGVTVIAESAFDYRTGITSVTLPEGLQTIGRRAFSGCYNMTSINIPDSVTEIGGGAFERCEALTSVHIPEGITRIENYAFVFCNGLTSVTIPAGVQSIGEWAFAYCENLTSVTIPEGVTSIEYGAFEGCEALTSMTMPETITYIGEWAFEGTPWYDTQLANNRFLIYNGYLYKASAELCTGAVTIPDGITTIGEYAFSYCGKMTSVVIPDSVTSIGYNAFYYCTALTSVTIPRSVKWIKDYAFSECASLTEVVISDGVERIGNGAFSYCSSLTSVSIPASVTSIGNYAFGETQWEEDQFAESPFIIINNILYKADKTQCIGSVTIPDGVTSISDFAFAYCSELTDLVIPDSVTYIGDDAFYYTPWFDSLKENNTFVVINQNLIYAAQEACTGHVTIPDGVTNISSGAFSNCYDMTSVTIPDSVKTIGTRAFNWCEGLTSVEIPSGVTSIGENAFYGCTRLESIVIPESVAEINEYAFCGCSNLLAVQILNPDCEIAPDKATFSSDTYGGSFGYAFNGIIYGYADSTAQAYAEKNDYQFVLIGNAPAKPEQTVGDVNGDNLIDAADAAAILMEAAELGAGSSGTFTAAQLAAADVNGDTLLDAADAAVILMYAAAVGAGDINAKLEDFV